MTPFANRRRLVRHARRDAAQRDLDVLQGRLDRYFAARYAGVDREPKPWLAQPRLALATQDHDTAGCDRPEKPPTTGAHDHPPERHHA